MIKIGDTGLLEGLPPSIAEQHWVKVIDAVYRERLKKELKVIERIHVYTAIDSLPEDLLDVLAVQFKVDWYRDDYPVETKRRVIKTAMEVRRYCGTEWAVKQAISAIYPNRRSWSGTTTAERQDTGGFVLISRKTPTSRTTPSREWKTCWDMPAAARRTWKESAT